MKKITLSLFKRFIKITSLILVLLGFSSAFAQQPNSIQFRGETVPMPENIDSFQWSQMPESARLGDGYTGWIQFYSTPVQEIQDQFKNQNLELLEYIPHKTYLFHFPSNTSIDFLKNSGVRSIVPVPGRAKLSVDLKSENYETWALDGDHILVTLEYFKDANRNYVLENLKQHQIIVLEDYKGHNLLDLSIPNNCLETLAELPYVKWVDLVVPPSVPDDTKGRSLHRSSNLDTRLSAGRHYTGEGVGVMVRDDGLVGPHIDFEGRLTNKTFIAGFTHGDGVAGIMAGAGNLLPRNRGMAAGADVYVVYYVPTFLDAQTLNLINDGDAQITNSSYSNGCNAGYTTVTVTVDQQMIDIPSLLHVFSAGNSNYNNCGYGAGNQWGNITGGHKQGKNVIATANVYFDGALVNSSSRGPAHDGRIKPDIAANGQDQISTDENNSYQSFGGTSGAAPGIAGISAQLYQAYAEMNGGDLPPAPLIKAALLNTANDAGNVGPDFKFGWGIVNALRAAKLLEDERHLSDEVSQGNTNTHTINVPAGTTQARFMVYWNDPAASAGADPALVNDLDLTVTTPSNTVLEPWILDSTPDPSLLNLPATTGEDHLNNMEQVLINNPAAGNYSIKISGFNVPMGPQEYYVVYELISENLSVTFPNGGESLDPFSSQVIHWDATNTTEDFVLEYSVDNGTTWENIVTVAADTHFYSWNVPNEITGKGLIKITSGAYEDISDANFSIARSPNVINVTMVCENSVTFEWPAVPNAESYDLYLLGEKYMEVVATANTNTVTIPITDPDDDFWYALSAKNSTEGWESERGRAKYYEGGLLDCTVGIDENVLGQAVVVYPNPANNTVNISFSDKTYASYNVTISNILGQKLEQRTQVDNSSQTTLDVSGYSAGIYFVTIEAGKASTTKKLIIQ